MLDRFRFGTAVEDARWDEDAQRLARAYVGRQLTADVLVSAAGALSDPKLPDIDGIDSFQGEVFHSSQWRHDHDLTGKRVAVIGTGASAIQIVPEIAGAGRPPRRLPAHRAVRHPAPRPGLHRGWRRLAFKHLPGRPEGLPHGDLLGPRDAACRRSSVDPALAAPAKRPALLNIERGISDPELREKVTPGLRDRLQADPDLQRLVPRPRPRRRRPGDRPDRARSPRRGIVTADGTEREIDVLVVATGFLATDLPIAQHIRGRDGVSLADHFAEHGMQAYKGATVHGFPNLFFVVGPNTGLGHSSMVFMIESQVAYAVDALAHDARPTASARSSPTAQAQQAWNDDLQRRMRRTVWSSGGCSSWYLDAHGRNVTLWPRTTYTFRRLTARFDTENYAPRRPRTPQHRQEGLRMKTLDGKVVVITGAGSGIGRALALRAADQGAILALSDWDEVGLVETAQQVQTSTHQRGAHRQARRPRPAGDARRTPRPCARSSAGSTSSSTTPAWRCTATSRRSPTRTSSGSWTSTSGASCRAPRSSCRT